MYDALLKDLEPFITKGWLTVHEDGKTVSGPITIIGTGETPLSRVYHANPRHIFFDAPLVDLDAETYIDQGDTLVQWDASIAPIASSKWLWWNYYPNVESLKKYSQAAHKRGIKARWWGVARWPAYFRRALWNVQLQAGVDVINADDLAE